MLFATGKHGSVAGVHVRASGSLREEVRRRRVAFVDELQEQQGEARPDQELFHAPHAPVGGCECFCKKSYKSQKK